MSHHSDTASDLPNQSESEPGPGDMPRREELQPRAAAAIAATRPMSSTAVAMMLADIFAGVPGFRAAKNPRRLERSFPSEGR